MPLITFKRDTIAKAEEVNANNQYLLSLIGEDSTEDRTVRGEYQFGPRRTGLISAQQDTGHAANRYLQVSWNADWEWVQSAGGWQWIRTLTNNPATSLRVGADGVTVLTTAQTTGNINSQLRNVFHIRPETGTVNGGGIYIPSDWHFQHYDAPARTMQDYRLTYTPLDSPRLVFDGAYFNRALTLTRSAWDYGIPHDAKCVSFSAHVTATNYSGSAFRVYQESSQRNWWAGMIVHAPLGVSNAGATGQRAGGWGVVPLGTGAHRGKFVIQTTAAFESVYLVITGYWL